MYLAAPRVRSVPAPGRQWRVKRVRHPRTGMGIPGDPPAASHWYDWLTGTAEANLASDIEGFAPSLDREIAQCTQDQIKASGGTMTATQADALCRGVQTKVYTTVPTPSLTQALANRIYGPGITLPGYDPNANNGQGTSYTPYIIAGAAALLGLGLLAVLG